MLARRGGDEVSGALLAEGYWRALGSKLSERQMDNLTDMVLDRCEWFPSVAECKKMMGEQSYRNPFYVDRRDDHLTRNGYPELSAPAKRIASAN